MGAEEEMFEKVFCQSVGETLRETGEEGIAARARKAEAAPGKEEAEERNLDHAVFRSWCPRCVKCWAEAYGHKKRRREEGEAPTVSLDYMYTRSEQEKEEEEEGMPIIAVKYDSTKLVMAKVAPSKGVRGGGGQEVRGAVGLQQDNREERQGGLGAEGGGGGGDERGDCHRGGRCRGSPSKRHCGEHGKERARPAPGIEGRAREQDQRTSRR